MVKRTVLKDTSAAQYSNYLLFAIASAEADFRISMLINQGLQIQLSLATDHELIVRKQLVKFRCYAYESEEDIERINLFVNRSGNQYLVPELKKIDYLLFIQSEASIEGVECKIEQLKALPDFTVLSKIDIKSLKSFSRLQH